MEPATPQQENPSVPAAGTQKPSASNRKQTNGAFGKAKALKSLSDYFPAPFRKSKRQHTFAANSVPKESE